MRLYHCKKLAFAQVAVLCFFLLGCKKDEQSNNGCEVEYSRDIMIVDAFGTPLPYLSVLFEGSSDNACDDMYYLTTNSSGIVNYHACTDRYNQIQRFRIYATYNEASQIGSFETRGDMATLQLQPHGYVRLHITNTITNGMFRGEYALPYTYCDQYVTTFADLSSLANQPIDTTFLIGVPADYCPISLSFYNSGAAVGSDDITVQITANDTIDHAYDF